MANPAAKRPWYIGFWYVWIVVAIAITLVWIFFLAEFFEPPLPHLAGDEGETMVSEGPHVGLQTDTADREELAALNETITTGNDTLLDIPQ